MELRLGAAVNTGDKDEVVASRLGVPQFGGPSAPVDAACLFAVEPPACPRRIWAKHGSAVRAVPPGDTLATALLANLLSLPREMFYHVGPEDKAGQNERHCTDTKPTQGVGSMSPKKTKPYDGQWDQGDTVTPVLPHACSPNGETSHLFGRPVRPPCQHPTPGPTHRLRLRDAFPRRRSPRIGERSPSCRSAGRRPRRGCSVPASWPSDRPCCRLVHTSNPKTATVIRTGKTRRGQIIQRPPNTPASTNRATTLVRVA